MIVEDHLIVNEGLAALLNDQPDMVVIGRAGSVAESMVLAEREVPDVLLLDFRLPDGNGAEALPAGLRALELSPLDPLKYYYNSLMASIAISAERYDLAISHAEQSLRVNASHLSSYRSLIIAQSLAGRPDAAHRSLARLMLRDPQFSVSRFAQGYPSRHVCSLRDRMDGIDVESHYWLHEGVTWV